MALVEQKPEHRRIPITELVVNPSNPRFEPVRDQNQAIKTMLIKEESSIKKLARDIVEHSGLNPTKSLAVCSKNGKYIIQEGNRRVVALKLLDDPDMAGNAKLQKFFTELKTKFNASPDVACAIFKTPDDAKHWVELEHTGKNHGAGIVSWDPIQKQRFLSKSSYLIKTIEYIGTDLDVSDVDPSTLDRLISTPYVRTKIGLTFSKGDPKELKPRKTILKNFKLVFGAMSKKNFSVRKIDRLDARKEWVDQVLDKDRKSSGTKVGSRTSRDPPPSGSRKQLIPSDCRLGIKEPRINDIFLELRDRLVLNGEKATPNAAAVLFRVFLEVSLDKYIDVAKIKLTKEPKIKEKIDKVAKDMKDKGLANDNKLIAIRRTSSGSATDILNIQWFHHYVHNSTILPESDGLKAKWTTLQEFFEILWGYVNSKS